MCPVPCERAEHFQSTATPTLSDQDLVECCRREDASVRMAEVVLIQVTSYQLKYNYSKKLSWETEGKSLLCNMFFKKHSISYHLL